jgi:hypothetical protein
MNMCNNCGLNNKFKTINIKTIAKKSFNISTDTKAARTGLIKSLLELYK